MAELLPENLRDRCKDALLYGNLYLADDDNFSEAILQYLDPGKLDRMTEEDLQLVWLSPNGFDSQSTIGASNTLAFFSEFENDPSVRRSRFFGVAIRVAGMSHAIAETLVALSDYPVIDDSLYSQMESNVQLEAWEGCVKQEFEEAIALNIAKDNPLIESVEFDSDDCDEGKWYKFFCSCLRSSGGEWIEESGSWYVYGLKKAAEIVTLLDLRSLGFEVEINLREAD